MLCPLSSKTRSMQLLLLLNLLRLLLQQLFLLLQLLLVLFTLLQHMPHTSVNGTRQ